MQRIEKRGEPTELTRWRNEFRNDPNFGYGLLCGKPAHEAVIRSLIAEQGGLCAYTGLRIHAEEMRGERGVRHATAHVEHLLPQKYCTGAHTGESVAYDNLVACFPGPNAPAVTYGATFKKSWPAEEERTLFVSPLTSGCEDRFRFNNRGEITAARADDEAAKETIRRLGLDCKELNLLRKAAIMAALKPSNPKQLRNRLNSIERESGTYTVFRFVVRQVLARRLKGFEGKGTTK